MGLVALNVLVYAAVLVAEGSRGGAGSWDPLAVLGLGGGKSFSVWQPLTYQFIHDPTSIWHLLSNMLFLWIFGRVVEARLRWWGFLLLYLGSGALAGLVQLLTSPALVIGASGSVMGVTGAFIVFYPRARVNVWVLLSIVQLPAVVLVCIYLALDLLGMLGVRPGGVAYMAHLAGFTCGFVTALTLLGTGLVRRTEMDLLYLFKQSRRRAHARAALRAPVHPHLRVAAPPSSTPPDAPAKASRLPNTTLAAKCMEEATQAYARGDFARAATAYERALQAAPTARDADQTRLMLAVIYGRKLNAPDRARAFLNAIRDGLPSQWHELATALRAELQP